MKVRWTLCGALICLLGLAGPGCDILKQATDKAEKEEEEKEAEEEEEKAKEEAEEKAEEEEEAEADLEDVEQKDYVQASVEIACVDMKLGDDDKIDLDGVEKEILGKYGMDEKTFEAAEEKFGGEDEADSAVEKKLEDCTEKRAKQYAGLIEGEPEKAEEKPKPDPTPKSTGNFSGQIRNEARFDNATLQLTITKDYEVSGAFRGKREGKGFRIPLDGNVSKSNELKASGADSGNRVSVSGQVGSSSVSTEVNGSIWDKDFTTSMTVK